MGEKFQTTSHLKVHNKIHSPKFMYTPREQSCSNNFQFMKFGFRFFFSFSLIWGIVC